MQAIMLAAGMGKRLGKYTKNNTKCMLEINHKTLVERTVESLYRGGVTKFSIICGYQSDNLKNFLLRQCQNPAVKAMQFEFIDNDSYQKTNNIYSLFLARTKLCLDDTILLESDLIYEPELISRLIDDQRPNLVAVAKYEDWMDGTVVRKGSDDTIIDFVEKSQFNPQEIHQYYKTVNIYKISKEFATQEFIPFLEAYIKAYGENEYYELTLKVIAHLSRSNLKALDVSDLNWYEIDNAQDLDIATCIFSEGVDRLHNFQKRYGGYWRFPKLLDFCYLVNPFFPTSKLLQRFEANSNQLLTQYPSGQQVNCIAAELLFDGLSAKHLVVGNGAAELIHVLGQQFTGKVLIAKPSFNEYIRCFPQCKFEFMQNYDQLVEPNGSNIIVIVNPDNPSGNFLTYEQINRILESNRDKIIIFDESFIDFARPEVRYTLLSDEILSRYPNLIVIKSISKSYGVPGARLGVLASGNQELVNQLRESLPVWNINSYGEYFLQVGHLYKTEYWRACNLIAEERLRFSQELAKLPGVKVLDSEANFIMCDLGGTDSTTLAANLLEQNIFIKDLKTKDGLNGGNFIRLAVRTPADNDKLLLELKKLL